MITVENLTKKYGPNTILDDISLQINEGEICGMIGLNGIGKTTFLKCVLDLVKINSGSIKIFGEEHKKQSVKQRFTFLPEKFNPNKYLTGLECLEIFLGMHELKLNIDHAKAIAHELDFKEEYLSLPVNKYSKGTAQKIGLIAAFMTDTKLMLLDEPMTGLDPRARIFLKQKLVSTKTQGRTIFFTSHILADVEEICDRIIVLDNTRVKYSGPPQEFIATNNATSLEKAFLNIISEKAIIQ